jgi:hypothetical protein
MEVLREPHTVLTGKRHKNLELMWVFSVFSLIIYFLSDIFWHFHVLLLKNRGRWPLMFFVVLPQDKRVIICQWLLLPSLSLLIKNLAMTLRHKKETKTQDTTNTNDEITAAPTNMHLPSPSRLPLSIVLLIMTVAPQPQGSFSCSSSRRQLLCNQKHRPHRDTLDTWRYESRQPPPLMLIQIIN